MYMTCLDLEGVLVPEIWIAFSEVSGIAELRRTTRDEPDYDKLMRWRMDILRAHGLGLKEIQDVIAQIDPLPGAKEFLDELRATTQAVIVSDTFEEFAQPLMKKLGWPTILCNSLEVGRDGMLTGIKMRCEHSKLTTVRALHRLRDHRLRRQLQRSGDDPRQQGRLPLPLHGQDQGRLSPAASLRDLRRASQRNQSRYGLINTKKTM